MNMMMLVGMSSRTGAFSGSTVGESCAMFLLLSGAVSLAIAGYLLYKAPKFQPQRVARRR